MSMVEMTFTYRIKRDAAKCPTDCQRCEEHWPGIKQRFNGQGFFDLDQSGMEGNLGRFAWAKNLCPQDAICKEVIRDKN